MDRNRSDIISDMVRFFKELYLTAFTMFFRLGVSRTPAYGAGKGVAGVASIEAILLLSVVSWIQTLAGTKSRIPKWEFVIPYFALCFANHYVLVSRGHGTAFECQFAHLKSSRRTLLLASCVAIVLAAVAFFIYSAVAHRRFLGIHD